MEHSYTELKTRIKSKIDDLSNWLSTNIVLLNGELAIVRLSGENDVRAKAGNGQDPFSELPYLNQSQIEELCSSLSNYVPLSGDSLVSNDLSVGSNLYVNGEILSSIISAYAPKIIFRQYFEE